MPTLVTETQLSEMVPLSIKTLRKWRWITSAGLPNPGPKWLKLGRKVAYDLDHVKAWLDSNTSK